VILPVVKAIMPILTLTIMPVLVDRPDFRMINQI
jgi:hypothetical protein